jgi:CheY-like chemotaxis protein
MNAKTVKILIADDDLEDLELMEEAILHEDPTVELHKFSNAVAAFDYLTTSPDDELPGLIVLDYNMPVLSGSQFLLSMNGQLRYQGIPKIILSTSNAQLHMHECMQNGATEYIVKPSKMSEVYSLARKLVQYCRV